MSGEKKWYSYPKKKKNGVSDGYNYDCGISCVSSKVAYNYD